MSISEPYDCLGKKTCGQCNHRKTGFDEFSRLSYHGCLDITKEAYQNRLMLLGIMTDAGWDFFRNEWWHYQLYNSKNFPIVNDI